MHASQGKGSRAAAVSGVQAGEAFQAGNTVCSHGDVATAFQSIGTAIPALIAGSRLLWSPRLSPSSGGGEPELSGRAGVITPLFACGAWSSGGDAPVSIWTNWRKPLRCTW